LKNIFSMLILTGIGVAVASCSSPPYVYKAAEFNRAGKDFGRPVTKISSVTVCYNQYSATPQQVSQLAIDECAAFNKKPIFLSQSYGTCPLATPIAAVYYCFKAE